MTAVAARPATPSDEVPLAPPGSRVPAWSLRRAALAGAAGLVLAAYGLGVHLAHAAISGVAVAHVPGSVLGIGGLVLLGVAYRRALRGRSWRAVVVAAISVLALLQWVALPVLTGALIANAPQGDVRAASTLGLTGARDVTFRAADGVRLAGWLVPGRNGAGVVVLHGSHSTRAATAAHVRLLAGLGYAVLSLDARGHGESAGATNAAGWTSVPDVVGAVAFLGRQPGVDDARIAGLGLSMGAEVLLRSIGEPDSGLAGVIADGAGASTLGDLRITERTALATSVSWASMRAAELFTGDDEPVPLRRVLAEARSSALFIASDARGERAIDEAFQRSMGPRATLWHAAGAGHTEGLDRHGAAYRAHVRAFLEIALSDGR